MSDSYIDSLCGALLLALIASGSSLGAVTVEHPDMGFSLSLPDGFERVTEDERPTDFVRVYRQSGAEVPLAVVVAIERLHGVLPRFNLDEAPANPNVQIGTDRWNEFDILVSRVTEVINDVPGVVLNAQVPLKPEAIQIKMMGPASQEPQLRDLLRDTLATLKGSTNWLNREERTQRLREGTQRLGITVAFIAVIVIGLIMGIRKLWRWKAT
jgi:hypothetical protein